MINPDFEQQGSLTNDPIVNAVVDKILKRHMQGMDKFGKTMESNDRPLDQWIEETIEEMIDAIHYLVKARTITDKFKIKQKELDAMLAKFKEGTFENEKPIESKDPVEEKI